MYQRIIEYVQSGKAWVLFGSGPSIEMGYPDWEQLARIALDAVHTEYIGHDFNAIDSAWGKKDYPTVFEEAKNVLGIDSLRQLLRNNLHSTRPGRIYEIVSQWPIPVFMTTNYDDEILTHLAKQTLPYKPYKNSEDDLSLLLPDLNGAIFKLHGDLMSSTGLILTTSDYNTILNSPTWQYWRTKMTSVFQMCPVIVIGQSLSDPNLRHMLAAAKKGARVNQPVIWMAPNVSDSERKELLDQYRIQVLPYDNRDGQHRNLVSLIETICHFIPPRVILSERQQLAKVHSTLSGPNAAAPGFFVFTVASKQSDFERKRIDIVVSAMEAVVIELSKLGRFALEKAFELAGWPQGSPIDAELIKSVGNRATELGLLIRDGTEFKVADILFQEASEKRKLFEHMRDLFEDSLKLRIRKEFSDLEEKQISKIAEDIEASLTQYFWEGGLTLTSILFSDTTRSEVPRSIIPFITMASTRYDDLTMRQAFVKTSVDIFVRPETVDKEYLGRISQGFFAFHALGVFGEAAIERLNAARETVWLIDSDTLIRSLALGSPVNPMIRECLSRLTKLGLRFFTTTSLLEEVREHLWFANKIIREHGTQSPSVYAAANGQQPYFSKSNHLLEGFIRWQDAGNPCDWNNYLYQIFGTHNFSQIDIKKTLYEIGIETVELKSWPGFTDLHFGEIEEYVNQIALIYTETRQPLGEQEQLTDPIKKATPEAEAYNIICKERQGVYNILSKAGTTSSSWFISNTSILNALPDVKSRITWQPQAFWTFASTVCDATPPELAEQAFDRLVLNIAQAGISLIDNDTIVRVFGKAFDEVNLDIKALHDAYKETLEEKYGESIESVMARVPVSDKPFAVKGLAIEIVQNEAAQRHQAETERKRIEEKLKKTEKDLVGLEKYRTKMMRQQSKRKKKKKKKNIGKKKN
jgi:hypothetical protein